MPPATRPQPQESDADRVARMQRALDRHCARVPPADEWDQRVRNLLARDLAKRAAELSNKRKRITHGHQS